MISAVAQGLGSQAVAVEYLVDGERSAAAVARGTSRLLGMAIGSRADTTYYDAREAAAVLARLGDRPRVYDDAVFGRTVERKFKLPSTSCFDDVYIMSRLLELEPAATPATPRGTAGRGQDAGEEAIRRCIHSLHLFNVLPAQLLAAGLDYVYAGIELPVVDPTVAMIVNGMLTDRARLEERLASTTAQSDILRIQIAEEAGYELNPDSPEQLRRYLFDRCGLPLVARAGDGPPSTADAVLERLEGRHPMISLLRQYRHLQPIVTGCRSILDNIDDVSIIHAGIDPLGASTGRFTCRNPNLQGLVGTLRDTIRARDGHLLVEVDISQTELRVLAHFSQDRGLVEPLMIRDGDIHCRTAAVALGIPAETVTDVQRERVGKKTNFAVIFGETQYGLSEALGVPEQEAAGFIDAYYRAYPAVRVWRDRVIALAHQQGEVRTLYGRRRRLPDIGCYDQRRVRAAERQAVNTIIQGTAADILKLAIVRLHGQLPNTCWLLLTVHDSFLLEVPEGAATEMIPWLLRIVEEQPQNFTVPIFAKARIGRTWADCKNQ